MCQPFTGESLRSLQCAGCQLRASPVYSPAFQNPERSRPVAAVLDLAIGRSRAGQPGGACLLPMSAATMEINPILNSIKDLTERTQAIRGYL